MQICIVDTYPDYRKYKKLQIRIKIKLTKSMQLAGSIPINKCVFCVYFFIRLTLDLSFTNWFQK